jgi:asparagine synthase (glutamine-hydrolysing)
MPSPRTFFEGIQSVPPGSVLIVEQAAAPRVESWWQPPVAGVDTPDHLDIGLEEAAGLVRGWLTDAVGRRLIADVPIGAFLSGGIDSSTVVALMSRLMDRPVQTFTIGFNDAEGFDERSYARLVAKRWGTEHVEHVVEPDAVGLVERLVDCYDEPFGDSSAVPMFLLCELTRRHVTVALSGDGGDELFAGYERFSAVPVLHRLRMLAPILGPMTARSARALRAGRRPRFGDAATRMATRVCLPLPEAWSSWLEFLPAETAFALTGRHPDWAIERQRRLWTASEGGAMLDRLLHLNLCTYLLDDLLPKADRMSMAHGLEVRSPLLDRTLLEQVATLPPRLKADARRRKRVLRAAVGDLVPSEVLTRPKRGFGVPLDRWFRTDLRHYFESTVLRPGACIGEHVQPAGIRSIWAQHQAGRSHGHLLWALLTLEVFLGRQS